LADQKIVLISVCNPSDEGICKSYSKIDFIVLDGSDDLAGAP
jgi:hypothetical protein